MKNSKKTKLIMLILFVGIVIALILFIQAFFKTVKITFKTNNVSSYEIREIVPDSDHETKENFTKTVNEANKNIRLRKNTDYIVDYIGNDGYKSDQELLSVKNSGFEFVINPYYSDTKLSQTLTFEEVSIKSSISAKYPEINRLYAIEGQKLHHYGEWYTAKLKYKGLDYFNADSLLIVLKKEKNSWLVKTDPPAIVISSISYPDIPKDILNLINNP